MVETVSEFRDELRELREDLYLNGEKADVKLLASYLDRLIKALDKLTESLELSSAEIDTLTECCSLGSGASKKMQKTKVGKKKPKPAKKKAAKKRRR